MKKGKMFKKSISCLLAALMIIASMPFSALSASAADSSISCAYNTLISQYDANRYNANSHLNIVNDGQSDSFSFAVWQYDLTNVKSLLGTNNMLDSASVTFSKKAVIGQEQPQKLTFYYATKDYATGDTTYKFVSNKLDLSENGVVNSDFVKDGNGDVYNSQETNGTARSSYVVNNLGLVPIKEFTSSETNSYSAFTIDLATALQFAINSGNKYFSIVAMLPQSDSTPGAVKWNDLNINSFKPTINFSYSEKTFEKTKKYTKSLMQNASSFKKTYSESYIGDTAKSAGYMKGFYKSGTWATQESNITRITCQENGGVYSNFSVSGPVNAVAIYDKAGQEIRFPVISYNAGGSGKHDNKIQYVALPDSLETNFSMGDTMWRRCSGTNNLTEYNDHNHDFNSYESKPNKTNTFYTNEYKQWRNFVNYTGSGNTDKYYDEVTSFSWKYSGVYGTDYSATYADIPVTYGVYILNLLPLNNIIDNCSSKFNQISANDSFYSEDSLATYYEALQNVLSFDASQYISTGSGDEVKRAADAVKKAVNNYNNAINNLEYKYTFQKVNGADPIIVTAKNPSEAYSNKPTNTESKTVKISDEQHTTYTYSWPEKPSGYVFTENKTEVTENHDFSNYKTECSCGYAPDFSAYNNAAGVEYQNISKQRELYGDSFSEYDAAVKSAAIKRNNVHSQKDIDDITFEILYAKAKLKKLTGTVTLKVYDQNNQEIINAEKSFTKDYGTEITIAPETEQNVYKYVIEEKDGTTSEIYGQQSISYVVTGDATVKAYCNEAQSPDKKYTKVTFLVGGKISDIKYVEAGETLDTSKANKLQFPFFTTGKWDKDIVEGKADGSSVTVRAELTPYNDNKCNVHFAGGKEASLAYNTKVDVVTDYKMDTGVDYALSTSWKTDDIIAYMHGTVFYVPARSEVYVLKVTKGESTKQPKINTVGVFSSYDENYKYVGFNCKFSLPADCTPVEWGITFIPILPSGRPDSSQVFRVKPLSAENEYTATLSLTKTSTKYSAIRAKAYLKYRDKDGVHVIEGDEHIQAFATENKFGITDINQNQN